MKKKRNILHELSIANASRIVHLSQEATALDKLSEKYYMASGLLVEIKDTTGNLKASFVVADGFKQETLHQLRAEIKKSIKLQTMFLKEDEK